LVNSFVRSLHRRPDPRHNADQRQALKRVKRVAWTRIFAKASSQIAVNSSARDENSRAENRQHALALLMMAPEYQQR
jgi:hypothetical protein